MNRTEAEKAAREIAWTMFRAPSEQVARMSAYPDCQEKRVMAMADIIERAGGQEAVELERNSRMYVEKLLYESNEKLNQALAKQEELETTVERLTMRERSCGETAWVSVETPEFSELKEYTKLRMLAQMATDSPCFTNAILAVTDAYREGWADGRKIKS